MWKEVLKCLPCETAEQILMRRETILEIRLRAGQRTELVCMDGFCRIGEAVPSSELKKIALRMMEYSYHSREAELARGYFTMKSGCRVGISGSFSCDENGKIRLCSIGSMCVRIAREFKGCAEELTEAILTDGRPVNALICSSPGLGKTTMLRDAARQLSDRGYTVGIADERHEIAACHDGVPQMDVGMRTDVADGCPKGSGMDMLMRSMSPQILITDEIGGREDMETIRLASRRGVSVIATAHAGSYEELQKGPLREILEERIFSLAAFLKDLPGCIHEIRRL